MVYSQRFIGWHHLTKRSVRKYPAKHPNSSQFSLTHSWWTDVWHALILGIKLPFKEQLCVLTIGQTLVRQSFKMANLWPSQSSSHPLKKKVPESKIYSIDMIKYKFFTSFADSGKVLPLCISSSVSKALCSHCCPQLLKLQQFWEGTWFWGSHTLHSSVRFQ